MFYFSRYIKLKNINQNMFVTKLNSFTHAYWPYLWEFLQWENIVRSRCNMI